MIKIYLIKNVNTIICVQAKINCRREKFTYYVVKADDPYKEGKSNSRNCDIFIL